MDQDGLQSPAFTGRKIFLSFRSRDEPQVAGIKTLLSNLGNAVVRMGEFPSGTWRTYIYKSIAEADTLLIYLSKEPERSYLSRLLHPLAKRLTPLAVRAAPFLTRFHALLVKLGWRRDDPADWMKEEFDHFLQTHPGSDNVIIYAEEDAERPAHLAEYQIHSFASDLTEIRRKWQQLLKDGVKRAEARQIILRDLKAKGIHLDAGASDVFFDTFGIHGIRSRLRYAKTASFRMMAQTQFYVVGAVVVGLAYLAGLGLKDRSIPNPEITQLPITVGQTGRSTCLAQKLVCTSVSQTYVYSGGRKDETFYGYTTPNCDSRLRRTTRSDCKNSWGSDYELTDIVLVKSGRSPSPEDFRSYDYMCHSQDTYEFANCVDPLGE